MYVALCGDKGAPGVTSSAIALASAWPGPAVAVEASPTGGDLALRLRPRGTALPERPTVLSLVTASRGRPEGDVVSSSAHVLNPTTTVIPGALLAEQMANIGDWAPMADTLATTRARAFVDVGHLHASSPMMVVAARADVVVAVSRADMASVVRLRERLTRLATALANARGSAPRLLPLLISGARHGDADVSDLLSLLGETSVSPFLVDAGFLAHDPPALRRLEAGEDPTGRLSRTDLLRTARIAANRIEAVVGVTRMSSATPAERGR